MLADSAFPAESVALATAPLAAALAAPPAAPADAAALELVLHRDHCLFDGRFANNGWLQELPDPLTRITWDNAAAIGPATAAALDLVHGDRVRLSAAGRSLECAVAVLPGLAPGTLAIALGYGRSAAGAVGNGVGFDAYRLRASGALHTVPGAAASTKLGGSYLLAGTQDHYVIDPIGFAGRESRVGELVQSADLATYRAEPDFARHAGHHPPLVSLWQEHAYEGHRWGMAIDLNTCIGCGACVVACQAENNIPGGGQGAGGARARDALDPRRPLLRGRAGEPGQRCAAGGLHAVRDGALRAGLPGRGHRAQQRRPERHGLQPLRRHALLRQQLPLQGAPLQLLQLSPRTCPSETRAGLQPRGHRALAAA